jgi:hypothetical protein
MSDEALTHEWELVNGRMIIDTMMSLVRFVEPEHRIDAINLVLNTFDFAIVPESEGAEERKLLLDLFDRVTEARFYPFEVDSFEGEYWRKGIGELFEGHHKIFHSVLRLFQKSAS